MIAERARFPAILAALAAFTVLAGAEGTADLDLLAEVRSISERLASMTGAPFAPPVAVRADVDVRARIAERRIARHGTPDALAARGRAWADVGLGVGDGPARLARALAVDLDGASIDAADGRILVDPGALPAEDFTIDGPTDADAQVLLATGVRPDEAVLVHLLSHVRDLADGDAVFASASTDEMLARAALAEGQANLIAVGYLFRSLGLADEVVQLRLDPGSVLDGRLVPAALDAGGGTVDDLLQFVYRDGFEAAAEAAAGDRLSRLRAIARTTRDVLHAERAGAAVRATEPGPPPDGMREVARDRLGEQAIVVLLARGTGKDNLALIAGDGWEGDTLVRWESAADPARFRTAWITAWTTAEDAEDFAYGYRRLLEARWPGRVTSDGAGGSVRASADGVDRTVVRAGNVVRVDVAPASGTRP